MAYYCCFIEGGDLDFIPKSFIALTTENYSFFRTDVLSLLRLKIPNNVVG